PLCPRRFSMRATLPHHRFGRSLDTADFDRFAVNHHGNLGGDDIFPVVAFVDSVIQALSLFLTFKATDPDVQIVFFLANEAADNDHALGNLEWNNFFFHEFRPLLPLSRLRAILPQFEEHYALLSQKLLPIAVWNVWDAASMYISESMTADKSLRPFATFLSRLRRHPPAQWGPPPDAERRRDYLSPCCSHPRASYAIRPPSAIRRPLSTTRERLEEVDPGDSCERWSTPRRKPSQSIELGSCSYADFP